MQKPNTNEQKTSIIHRLTILFTTFFSHPQQAQEMRSKLSKRDQRINGIIIIILAITLVIGISSFVQYLS